MRTKAVVLSIVFVAMVCGVRGQVLQVQNTQTPAQLVQNVLLGSGVQAFNITFNGMPANTVTPQVGYFISNGSNIGISSGLILASGNVATAVGPNNASGAGTSLMLPGDPDLNMISNNQTFDAAVLEFDFVATGDTVKFNFVFASEEYPEYTCCTVNDPFGFFISGPGFSGPYSNNAVNIALVPGTSVPIEINSLNGNCFGQSFCGGGCCGSFSQYYVDNTGGTSVQYDGFTTVLTAVAAPLTCGDTFHIKIAISDAGDGIYDSGVFLQEGSFSSNNVSMSSNIDVQSLDSVLYEGCGVATLLLVRSDTTDTLTFMLNVMGTATNGVDYNYLSPTNYFLPGEDSVSFNLWANMDGIAEGYESVIIQLIQTICGLNDTQQVIFYIGDYDSLQTVPNNPTKVCVDDVVPVYVTLSGGDWPFTYSWQPGGSSNDTLYVSPSSNTYYVVTITDECNKTIKDTVYVTVMNHPPLTNVPLNDITLLCPGDAVTLSEIITGGSGNPLNAVWSNGVNNYNGTSVTLSPTTTTTYYFYAIDACSKDTVYDTVTVIVPVYPPVYVFAGNDTMICSNKPVILTAVAQGGTGVYSYQWSNGDTTQTAVDQFTQDGYLAVAVTDQCGNTAKDTVYVDISLLLAAFTYSPTSPIKLGTPFQCTDQSTNPIQWEWTVSNGASSGEQNPTFTINTQGVFTVCLKITNPEGCQDQVCKEVEIYEDLLIPNVITPNGDGVNDVFFIKGLVGTNKITIYNRWGRKIYENDNYQNDWDGEGHSDGTYYYILVRHNGEEHTGYVTVLNK